LISSERGVVMERQGKRVTVLTPQGEWRTLYLTGSVPEVGEEIMLPPLKKKMLRPLMGAIAVILLLVLTLPLARQALAPAVPGELAYYIAIDINPSIELAVDKRERVIDARGLNSDGENLLAAIALKDEKAAAAIEILAKEAVRQGYFLPGQQGAMLLAVVPVLANNQENMVAGDALGRRLTGAAQNIFRQAQVKAVVQATTVQPEIRQHAADTGLSAGKYGILLEALEAGLPVTADDLQQESVAKALAKYNGNWQQIWEKMREDKDLLKKEERLGETLKKALAKRPVPRGKGASNGNGTGKGVNFPAEGQSQPETAKTWDKPGAIKANDNPHSDKGKRTEEPAADNASEGTGKAKVLDATEAIKANDNPHSDKGKRTEEPATDNASEGTGKAKGLDAKDDLKGINTGGGKRKTGGN